MNRPDRQDGTLVLTRRAGEGIQIGAEISVHIIEIRGGSVRVAITAPRSVNIVRDDAVNTQPKEGKK